MTMTDPVADLLTRVRNANRRRAKTVRMPASKLKVRIAHVLKDEGYIREVRVEPAKPQSELVLDLKYGPDGEFVIREIKRISKPGCRVYAGAKKLPRVLRGQGICVLSTPKGVLSDRAARLENVGGEILCQVY
ncbi:MAG TPA: 30S ribosomal protein S8 [Planctomycetota bacterium]